MIDVSLLSPVCFTVLGVDVYWYGVAYVVGMILAVMYAHHLLRRSGETILSVQDVDAFVPWAWVGILVGGRLGHVVFYGWSYYAHHLMEIVKFRDGGMSFHGGLLGVGVAVFVFCSRRHISVLSLMDIASTVAPIGLFLGRVANFVNNELYGIPTKMPWGCTFRGAVEPRHPTQLYEAMLEGVITFAVMFFLWKRHPKRSGVLTAVFLLCYATSRILVDFVKDTPHHLGLTMGQWLSIELVAVSLGLLLSALRKREDLLDFLS